MKLGSLRKAPSFMIEKPLDKRGMPSPEDLEVIIEQTSADNNSLKKSYDSIFLYFYYKPSLFYKIILKMRAHKAGFPDVYQLPIEELVASLGSSSKEVNRAIKEMSWAKAIKLYKHDCIMFSRNVARVVTKMRKRHPSITDCKYLGYKLDKSKGTWDNPHIAKIKQKAPFSFSTPLSASYIETERMYCNNKENK